MNYEIELLYPTPIYFSQVKNFDDIQSEIKSAIDNSIFKVNPRWNSHYLSDINFDNNLFSENSFDIFLMELDFHLRNYCNELRFPMKKYKVESWLSMFKSGNYGHIHSHGHVDISGVYYYHTNGKDGDLFFECPVPNIPSSFCMYESTCDRWNHKPENGKILLFPGWLKHGIETNTTDNTRISLSFNITFDRGII